MGWIWDMPLPQDEKLIALAYADHAHHDGTSIFPAVKSVSRKTGYSPRSVQRITRKLEERGLLIDDGEGPKGTRKWRMPIPENMGGVNLSPLPSTVEGGDTGVRGGVTSTTGGGDTAMSPEPSLKQPSIKPSEESAAAKREFLKSRGVGKPALDQIADNPGIELPYLEAHFQHGDDRGDSISLIIHRIKAGDAAPKIPEPIKDYWDA